MVDMPGVRKDGRAIKSIAVDEELWERWEKHCCRDGNGDVVPRAKSKRIEYLLRQDVEKNRRRKYPPEDWLE